VDVPEVAGGGFASAGIEVFDGGFEAAPENQASG